MEHHLLILLGLHPKVFTESLYALCVRRDIPVSQVTVISTASAKQKTIESLLTPETGKFYQVCREYPDYFDETLFSADRIRVATEADKGIWDIGNTGHSHAYLDLILKCVWEITADDNTCLHAVVAGGRRTLSVYLAMVMQMLARKDDRLYHLVVDPWEVETQSDFYYPTRESFTMVTYGGSAFDARDVFVELVEIPFIRLRNRLPIGKLDHSMEYYRLLAWVQETLNGALVFPELVLDLDTHSLKIGRDTVCLQPQQFALYWYFADVSRSRRQEVAAEEYAKYFEPSGSPYFSDKMLDSLLARFDVLDDSQDMRRRFVGQVLENRQLPATWVLQKISRINSRLGAQLSQAHLIPYYQISTIGPRGNKYYGLKVDGQKIQTPKMAG